MMKEKELQPLSRGIHSMLDLANRLDKERRMQDVD